ncbi:(2Fe-2S)-binding protein [Paucibacter sp. DJ2R-2]|uniref:(2Fe-2S)-binding protein n=1 Tax=Paucibacter sp. DJ2R-2 TaxID=2893558 RepID=UPI0021E3B6AF|nr:(2Fe-2S)-binding protein [Paucibacter sp. DJ2R-2]MCV2421733.1 (2Fe-2S)-binding protein [Paucibacter sp. DJ4R-1]MCV2438438.1 (2Fe-2S)-binding protein [Paucibacter sp. DJ2R-2]
MSTQLTVNGQGHSLDVEADTPLLWVLRDELGLTGTKFGCGVASCGACTVDIDGTATRSCVMPVGALQGKHIRTIEAEPDRITAALQAAWIQLQVPQCGYCQSGMIMAATALLRSTPKPSDADIDAGISNLCRCGTYQRIRAGIHAAAAQVRGSAA